MPSHAGAAGLILGVGAKMLHALWSQNQNIKQEANCNEVNTDFKMANIKKTNLKKEIHKQCMLSKVVVPQNILNERRKLQRPHIV